MNSNENLQEKLPNILLEIESKYNELKAIRNSEEYQKQLWTPIEQKNKLEELLTREGRIITPEQISEYMRVVFPYTPQTARAILKESILWNSDANALFDRLTEQQDNTPQINFVRRPGSDILGLDNPTNKEKYNWTKKTIEFINTGDFSRNALIAFGKELANSLNISSNEVLALLPKNSKKYIFTYHFEACNDTSHIPHSCGAHGSDTFRAIIGLVPQVATYLWAKETEGENSEIQIWARRTKSEHSQALLGNIPLDFDEFVKLHFTDNITDPKNYLNILKGKPDTDNYPNFQTLHSMLLKINGELSDNNDTTDKSTIIGCVDDRVKNKIKDGQVIPSEMPSHISNTVYMTMGMDALNIQDISETPPRIYKVNILPGAQNIDEEKIRTVKDSILYEIKLIKEHVMSDKLKERHLFIDVVTHSNEESDIVRDTLSEIVNELRSIGKTLFLNYRIINAKTKTIEINSNQIERASD